MKGKWKKRIITFVTALLAGVLMSHGLFELASDLAPIHLAAEGANTVSWVSTTVEANSSNLVLAEMLIKGTGGDHVIVTYRTSPGTAIENVDYAGIFNTVDVEIPAGGEVTQRIAVKCLDDASTREKLRVYDKTATYGRYFNLHLISASNATIDEEKKVCKCYLSYDHRVEATTGIIDNIRGLEIAYLNDYKNMETRYHKGDNDISGKEHWRTWKEGVSFNCDNTKRWINTYINPGFASAYGSYVIKSIDDDKLHSNTNIHLLSGNKEFMDKYSRSTSCPGLSLYYEIEPCTSGGYRIDGRAMYYIAETDKNPWKMVDELVDLEERNYISPNRERIYWIQNGKTWYSGDQSVYDSIFYKTDPYNGNLDYGLSIYNGNKSWDREVHDIWLFLTLYDNKAPVLQNQYTEYDPVTDKIRVYLRFNEPVYSSKRTPLSVKVNSLSSKYAYYKEGNFSDTLVYELERGDAPNDAKITSVKATLPNDIGDLAYKVNSSKVISNNLLVIGGKEIDTSIAKGAIDLCKPKLGVDIESSAKPKSVYEIQVWANEGGLSGEKTDFDAGTVYYSFDKNETIAAPYAPSSYANAHVLTSEERGSFFLTLAKNEAQGIDSGKYWLHLLAVSDYGLMDATTKGSYLLDGDAPVATLEAPETDTLRRKDYRLKVEKKALDTKISRITAIVDYESEEGEAVSASLDILSGGEIPSSLSGIVLTPDTSHTDYTIYKYNSNIDENEATPPLDQFILGLLGTRSRLPIDIRFEVEDEAGNKTKTASMHTVYDKRTLFEYSVEVPASYHALDAVEGLTTPSYDISSAGSDGLTFTLTEQASKDAIDAGCEYSIALNGETTVKAAANSYSITLSGLTPGYYEAVGRITTGTSGTETDMVAKTYSFYLTNGLQDTTINKSNATGSLVLSNRVYELTDSRFYYFSLGSNSVANHLYGATINPSTGKYEGGSSAPTFSSADEAKKYVKFMEYQDLELVQITSTQATFLNSPSSSTTYVKAAKETKNAVEGQLWVHYKKSTWNASVGANGWAFYYYGEGNLSDGINHQGLSMNLSSAIDAVTSRIVSEGTDRYLVGEDYTSRFTGAPFLNDPQMHVDKETAATTKTGSLFVNPATYNGDANIYQNNVTIESVQYPLATNLSLYMDYATTLYYRPFGGSKWNKIEAAEGTTLKNALGSNAASGIYDIREYGRDGISEFSVYVDHDIPVLSATQIIANPDGTTKSLPLILDGSETRISGQALILGSLQGEIDPQAYVAIYSYPNRSLQTVLYGSKIQNYELSDGNYYIEVGDRSGNVVTYMFWSSSSKLEVTAETNESKTGVVVRVNNRDDDEIYSYEVYLNDTLIDQEFAPMKVFRGAGIYRIEVVDIYGNSKVETITFDSPTPALTWYYQNDNGGYSLYDPNKPGKMVLEDDVSSPRTTNVYSSAMVRILFNNAYESDEVQFEVLDISSSDYSYNETTGILSINTLANWRLRVWYKSQPENDRTYVFSVDADAPEVSATFIGEGFHPYVVYDDNYNVILTSSFDSIPASYNEGDVVNLDTLAYENDGQKAITFHSGNVFSGNHIVLLPTDASGIREVTITRNGVAISVVPDQVTGEYILNGYGTYVVKIVDNLGNTTTFVFANIESGIASATVDGESIDQVAEVDAEMVYGHDTFDIETYYDGTNTVIVRVGEKAYTYEFHYENGVLTYGHYTASVEIYHDEEQDADVKVATADYVQAKGYVLDVNSGLTLPNVWYAAVENDDFVIYAMIDLEGHARYRFVAVYSEVKFETRFEISNVHVPMRYTVALSKEQPTITLLTGGEEVQKIESLEYIFITKELTIKEDGTELPNIVSIQYSYSETDAFDGELITLYKDGAWVEHLNGEDYGYYKVLIKNRYGNESAYLLSKIASFASVVKVTWLDGASVTYNGNEGTIYSNSSIELIIFSTEVEFYVNNVRTTGVVESGSTSLTLTADGSYHVKAQGINGIYEEFDFVIGSDLKFAFVEDWVIGYNEQALLRDQGYTNKMLDIILDKDKVAYIYMVVNDQYSYVLYDAISDQKIINPALLKEAVGRYGAGKYTIGFRNKYGDLASKTVHFDNNPSIVLSRTIASDPTVEQIFDLALAISNGFYSNNSLIFSTSSLEYEFTINGASIRLDQPKVLEFSNVGGRGSFEYLITYLDEYGNYVEFKAYLKREEVEFDASAMELITLGASLYTRDDVVITFAEGLKATLSIDGGEVRDYLSGEYHYADGEYRFVVRDIAGNNVAFTVIHKSVNHYSLTVAATGEDVIDGGVINNSNVIFSSDDGSKIKYVVRNGELVEEFTSTTFSMTGHYEIIIEDNLGNQSYEEFTILNNSLSSFSYTAPFEYEVTDVFRLKLDGTPDPTYVHKKGKTVDLTDNGDYLVVVTSTKTASSFNFTVTIDNTPPTAALSGVEDGGVTGRDVSITGTRSGDIVKIYKDGELISTTTITLSTDAPKITSGGRYKVTVTNLQGVTVEFNFTRKSISNVPGSIFIISFSVLIVTALAIGLTYHTKLKTDD